MEIFNGEKNSNCIGDYIEIIFSISRHSLCLQGFSLSEKI